MPVSAAKFSDCPGGNSGLQATGFAAKNLQLLPAKLPRLIGSIGDRAQIGTFVRDGEWNQYAIIARGGVILQIVNGHLMAVLVDDDPASSNNVPGLFGLQIEGVPSKVFFRNLRLRKTD